MALAPPRWLLKAKDPELFDREYRKQLDALDARQVADGLGPNAILLCWESFNVRCHRRLVAEWLEENLGIVVPELDHERAESIPFSEQPSKWDGEPKVPARWGCCSRRRSSKLGRWPLWSEMQDRILPAGPNERSP